MPLLFKNCDSVHGNSRPQTLKRKALNLKSPKAEKASRTRRNRHIGPQLSEWGLVCFGRNALDFCTDYEETFLRLVLPCNTLQVRLMCWGTDEFAATLASCVRLWFWVLGSELSTLTPTPSPKFSTPLPQSRGAMLVVLLVLLYTIL